MLFYVNVKDSNRIQGFINKNLKIQWIALRSNVLCKSKDSMKTNKIHVWIKDSMEIIGFT